MPAAPMGQDDRTWGMLAHLLSLTGFVSYLGFWLAPLVVWLVYKDRSPFVADQAKESLNFQITMFLATLVAGVLCFVLIGFLLIPIIFVMLIIFPILGAISVNEGKAYRYPLTLRLIP